MEALQSSASNESAPNENLLVPRFSTIEAEPGSHHYEVAIPLSLRGNETPEEINLLLEAQFQEHYWWFRSEWKKLAEPLEVLKFSDHDGVNVELYNWCKYLTTEDIANCTKVFESFKKVQDGVVFRTLKYILANPTQPDIWLPTGEAINGRGTILPASANKTSRDGVIIYPHAFEGQHRIATLQNFLGTLIHEVAHHLAPYLALTWQERFGWVVPENVPSDQVAGLVAERQRRCVTEYAQTDFQEDICESIVAWFAEDPSLDEEKRYYLQQLFSSASDPIRVDVQRESECSLPEIPPTVYYKKVLSGIRVGPRAKRDESDT